jgi:type IV secretory pathway TraG/TraD family ATPase VirD4
MAHKSAAQRVFFVNAMKGSVPFWFLSWAFFYFFTLPYVHDLAYAFEYADQHASSGAAVKGVPWGQATEEQKQRDTMRQAEKKACPPNPWREIGDNRECITEDGGKISREEWRAKWQEEYKQPKQEIKITIDPELIRKMQERSGSLVFNNAEAMKSLAVNAEPPKYAEKQAIEHLYVGILVLLLAIYAIFFPHKYSLFNWPRSWSAMEKFCLPDLYLLENLKSLSKPTAIFYVLITMYVVWSSVGVLGIWIFNLKEIGFAPLLIAAPLLIKAAPIYALIALEIVKETKLYRDFFIVDKGGDNARLGGLLTFIQRDMTGHFSKNEDKIVREEESTIFLGRTWWRDDFKMKGRDVGLRGSEQHLITIAATGSGKSRDMVWSNLLTYNGGIVGLDLKGEHVRVCKQRRENYAPFYVIDPYGEVSDIVKGVIWNPLDEIDAESKTARENIGHIAQACIYKHAMEGGNEAHWRESAIIILRGFIGHVLTRCPEEKQHLGTVYDLICTGEEGGKYYNPKAFTNLLMEMMTNDSIQGIARDAASKWMEADDRAKAALSSTVRRGIDWINNVGVRAAICGKSAFSMRDIKSKDATVFLVIPEAYFDDLTRFIRTFYTLAFDMMDNFHTLNPKDSKRKVWFLMEEANKIGHMQMISDALNIKRSSHIKLHLIYQNFGQVEANFSDNISNVTAACDFQFFGLAQGDTNTVGRVCQALGSNTRYKTTPDGDTIETTKPLYTAAALGEKLNVDGEFQLIIPIKGRHPFFLKRVPYYKLFSKTHYGERLKKQTENDSDKQPREKTAADRLGQKTGNSSSLPAVARQPKPQPPPIQKSPPVDVPPKERRLLSDILLERERQKAASTAPEIEETPKD